MKKKYGFTLIELLIVVAIIAILAAIAVPNFLEAQVRSKASRVKADMRSVATALEAYSIDYNRYPRGDFAATRDPDPFWLNNSRQWWLLMHLYELTTPTAYMTSVSFNDPFMPNRVSNAVTSSQAPKPISLAYYFCEIRAENIASCSLRGGWLEHITKLNSSVPHFNLKGSKAWMLASWGPDRQNNNICTLPLTEGGAYTVDYKMGMIYDATNGTTSKGDIARTGGTFVTAAPTGFTVDPKIISN